MSSLSIGNNIPAQYVSIETVNSRRLKISYANSPQADSTPWAFNVLLGNAPELQHVQDIKLVTCSITNTVPNVSTEQLNNVFSLEFSVAGLFSTVVPTGFYSYSDLVSYLKPLIDAFIAPSVITMDLGPGGYVRFTVTGPETMKNTVLGTLNNTLGFITLNAFAPTMTAELLPKLNGPVYFHINSEKLGFNNCFTNGTNGQVNSAPCLFSVPIFVGFGLQNAYQGDPLDRLIYGQQGISIQSFDIELRDEKGRLLTDMDPRSSVELIFKISY
jgi:hypothetical protein